MKSYNIQQSLSIFLIIIFLVNSTEITNHITNTIKEKVTLADVSQKNNDLIIKEKGPGMPNKIPNEVQLMQVIYIIKKKILLKAYGMAEKQQFPRFSEETSNISEKSKELERSSDPHNRIPWNIIKERWHDEESIGVKDAWSDSVFQFNFQGFTFYFPALNPVRGWSYWCSKPFIKPNKEVIWEASLFRLTRVHAIDLIWAFAPGQFKIQYSHDGSKFIDLIKWRDSINGAKSGWWDRIAPQFKYRYIAFPDRISFDHPVWAKKIRIIMRNQVNKFFGLYRVEIKVRNWITLIKNIPKDSCEESCWTVNSNNPIEGDKIESTECFGQIFTSENRELFLLNPEGIIYHFASGLCVVSTSDKKLKLQDCWKAIKSNDGRVMFNFQLDGSIKSDYSPDECISIPEDPEIRNLSIGSRVEVTSVVGTGDHQGERAVDGNPETYWATHPGEKTAVITVYLEKWVTAHTITIKWKYQAQEFDVYALTFEKGWKHMYKVTGNIKTENSFNLKLYSIKALQIKMSKNLKKYMNLPIYGIIDIEIDDGGTQLTRELCKKEPKYNKRFIIDEQYVDNITAKQPYVKAWNNLTKLYLKLRNLNRMIHLDWKHIATANKASNKLKIQLSELKMRLDKIFEKLKLYKSKDLISINHHKFIKIVENHQFESYFKSKENREVNEIDIIGTSIENPVSDCYVIKKLNPFRKSGFYWIKPHCSKKALRTFCDFSIEGKGLSIYVFNNNQHPNTELSALNIKTKEDIHLQCAKLGLEPINVLNKDVMKRIVYLLKVYGWDLGKPNVIPLGYDYECEMGLCSEEYDSFNSDKSEAINDFFLKKRNHWDKLKDEKKDSIGLGYSRKGKPYLFNLKEAKITALICSTNKSGKPGESDFTEISCFDNLTSKAEFSEKDTSIKVKCPSLCKSAGGAVFGTGIYAMTSSICTAALHSGVITDIEGGELILKIKGKMKNFKGSISKGITSFDLNKTLDLTFSVEKSKGKCPIDYILKPKNTNDEDVQIKLPPLNKPKSINKKKVKRKNTSIGTSPSLKPFMIFPQPVPIAKINIAKAIQISKANKKKLISKDEDDEETKKKKKPSCAINTDNAEKWIKNERYVDLSEFKLYEKYGRYMNVLITKFIGEFSWSRAPGQLSLSVLRKSYDNNEKFLKNLLQLSKLLEFKSNERIHYTETIYKKLKHRLLKLDRHKEYKMNYENINKEWFAYDYLISRKGPSQWIVTNKNLKGKPTSVLQTSPIWSIKKIASIYYLKYRRYYDFKLNLDVMVRESGKIGVIFRMKDPFNYYALEISQKRGYKRFIKVVNGRSRIIEMIKDGGIFQSQWFRIQIIGQRSQITFKFGDDGINYDKLPIILVREDQTHRRGTVGVFVNRNNAFYFNNVEVSPLECWTPYEPRSGISLITDRSNVYDENYRGAWNKKYFIKDPVSKVNGPSDWMFVNDEMDRESVIQQKSSIYDKSSHREPSMFILKDKFLKRGWFSVDFAGFDNGRVGVVFKYMNPNNYYLLEIGGFTKENRMFEFRKKVNGMIKLIKIINSNDELDDEEAKKSEDFGYIPYRWYSLRVLVDVSNIKIFYKKVGSPEKLILQSNDDDLKIGLIGLTTSGTKANFDNIVLRPKVEEQKFVVTSNDFSNKGNIDDDVFLYDSDEKGRIIINLEEEELDDLKNKPVTRESTKYKKTARHGKTSLGVASTYLKCLINRKPSQRKNYCKKEFKGIPGLEKKCRENFCKFCCDRNVAWTHKNHVFSCKRSCNKLTKVESDYEWKKICINVPKPNFSIYAYCDERFKGFNPITNCKLDTCRLCCVTYDQVTSKSYSIENLNKCFKTCAETFKIDPSKEII